VAEPAAHQEFHGQVVEALHVGIAIALLGLQQAVYEKIANRQRERFQQLVSHGTARGTRQGVADVTQDGVPQVFRTACGAVKKVTGHSSRVLRNWNQDAQTVSPAGDTLRALSRAEIKYDTRRRRAAWVKHLGL